MVKIVRKVVMLPRHMDHKHPLETMRKLTTDEAKEMFRVDPLTQKFFAIEEKGKSLPDFKSTYDGKLLNFDIHFKDIENQTRSLELF